MALSRGAWRTEAATTSQQARMKTIVVTGWPGVRK
jgi:hypothetical protein